MKKLILIAASALLMVASIAVGITIAWFTDTKETTNVFTAGDVSIRLEELDPDGEMVDITNQGVQMDYGHVYPGRKVVKNTSVTNIGSEVAYIAAEIVIIDGDRDINAALSIPGEAGGTTRLDEFFEGGLWGESFTRVVGSKPYFVTWESANYIIQYDKRMTDGFWINVFVKNSLDSGNTLELWDGFTFPDDWGNEEMLQCANLRISIKVFAAQAAGFSSCTEAITTSFGNEFGLPE